MRPPPSRPFPYDYTRRAASRSGGESRGVVVGWNRRASGIPPRIERKGTKWTTLVPLLSIQQVLGLAMWREPSRCRHAAHAAPARQTHGTRPTAPRGPDRRSAWTVMGRTERPRHAGPPGRAAACELVQECRRLRTRGAKNGQFVQECRRLRTCGTTSPIAPAIHGKRLPYPRLSQSVHLRLFKHGTSCSDGTQPLARFETVQEPAGADPAAQSKGFLDRGAPPHAPESQSAGFVDGREERGARGWHPGDGRGPIATGGQRNRRDFWTEGHRPMPRHRNRRDSWTEEEEQQERSQEVAAGTADTPKDLNTWQPRRCCRQRHSPQASTTDSYNKGPPTAITPRAGSGAKSSPATATKARPRRRPSACRARPRTPRAWRPC